MNFSELIEQKLLILVPILYIIGIALKKSTVNDKYIPMLLGIFGILLTACYRISLGIPSGWTELAQMVFSSVTQGLLCASASVYANNIYKQMKKGGSESADKDS